MGRWLRRIRAALLIGVVWGFAWFGAGMVLLMIVGFGAADVPFPLGFGLLGFLAGTVFSGVIGVAERGRRADQLSLPRFALWGALGGFLLSVGFVTIVGITDAATLDLLTISPIFALAGAGSAAASLALARGRGEDALSEDQARRLR